MKLACKKGCGKCCEVGGTGMLLPVTVDEAEGIGRALGVTVTAPGTFNNIAHCPAYLEGECLAYDARPQVCRDFQCNGEDRFTHSVESLEQLVLLATRTEPTYDLRAFIPESTAQIIARHERIAFQFSGGKDSTAALLLLRPFWDRLTVYYCDSGDAMPETKVVVEQMSKLVPIVTIQGRVQEVRKTFGLPTDVLPWTSAASAHQLNTGTTPLMQDRVSCCYRSVMLPIYERMVEDKITLVIRGQKNSDGLKGPLHSGDVDLGVEYLYPIQDWMDEECFAYMRHNGFEPQRFYSEGLSHSGDCMHCTAWLCDDKATYLKAHYPAEFPQYQHNIKIVAGAVFPQLVALYKEAQNCEGV